MHKISPNNFAIKFYNARILHHVLSYYDLLYALCPNGLSVLIIREINSKAEPGNDNIITSTQQPRRRRSSWEQLNIRRPYNTRDTAAIAAAATAVVQWYEKNCSKS